MPTKKAPKDRSNDRTTTPPVRATTTPFAPKRKDGTGVTHERIEADPERFRKAGGHIEVLATTRAPAPAPVVPAGDAPSPDTAPPPVKRKSKA